jgi:tRNA (mo5U34)-methyltransferase
MAERLATLTAHSPPGTEARALGPWFHNLHLPDGTQTAPAHPLGDFPSMKWRQVAAHVPLDLSGLTVLDVGCNAGFYSFELARRGAHVRALDIDRRYLRQAEWAAGHYGLRDRVELQEGSVYCLARAPERYDIVWFFGVLYHLRHPLLALDILRNVTRGKLFLQTLTSPGARSTSTPPNITLDERAALNREGWPRMAFIEHALENDPTNWWAPNGNCVEAMLRAAGFRVVARPADEMYIAELQGDEPPVNAQLRRAELQAILGAQEGDLA